MYFCTRGLFFACGGLLFKELFTLFFFYFIRRFCPFCLVFVVGFYLLVFHVDGFILVAEDAAIVSSSFVDGATVDSLPPVETMSLSEVSKSDDKPSEFVQSTEHTEETVHETVSESDVFVIENTDRNDDSVESHDAGERFVERDDIKLSSSRDLGLDFQNRVSRPSSDIFDDGTKTVAWLSCPQLGFYDMPIHPGFDQWICDNYDGCFSTYYEHVFGDGFMMHIAGHNYKTFSVLSQTKVGYDFYLETSYGADFHYRATRSELCSIVQDTIFHGAVDSNGSWFMQANEVTHDICMTTCHDGCPDNSRWFVRCELIEGSIVE